MGKGLERVTKGIIRKPHLLVLYGPDGVGKSTFGADAPNSIFVGGEDGTNDLNVSRFPQPETWEEVLAYTRELADEEHDYKTVVYDSLDWIEPLCWNAICRKWKKGSIELASGGYGKGYKEAAELFWPNFFRHVDRCRNKGMNVIFLAHSQASEFNDPQTQTSYKRYELKLHHLAASKFREYVDAVLFANFEIYAKEDDRGREKAFGDGARIIHTERRPGWDAKTRRSLPLTMPLDWGVFSAAWNQAGSDDVPAVLARIEVIKAELKDEELVAKIDDTIAKFSGDYRRLLQVENRIKVLLNENA